MALALQASRDATEEEVDARWQAVTQLQARAEPAVFEMCRDWCTSAVAAERRLGADVLGQLGYANQSFPFRQESLPILRSLLADPVTDVVAAALIAFGHLGAAEHVADVAAIAGHEDAAVRHAVAFALLGQGSDLAVDTLITLSRDEDSDVRDWATFGLGAQIDIDTPKIRDALLARATDEDTDTRAEALAGLVRRRDPRVLEPLRRALESETVGTMEVEAARDSGARELIAPLEALRSWWDVDPELLEQAIAACAKARSGADPRSE